MRLTLKLPAMVIGAILLTAVAGSALSILIGRYVLRQEALDNNARNVSLYASAVRFYVENARSMLTTTAELPQLRSLERSREVAGLVLTHSEVFEYVMLLAPDGTVAMLEPRALDERLSHRDLSFFAWFGEVRRSGRPVVSDLHISPATQRPTIVIATPVLGADGSTLGIWAGALKLGQISQIGTLGAGRAAWAESGLVTDRRGLIIAHQSRPSYVENQTDFSAAPSVSAALAGQTGSTDFFSPMENEQMFAAYLPLPDLGWAVVYHVSSAIALAPLDALTLGNLSASLALAALLGAGMYVLSRRTVAPLARLTVATQTVGTGDFSQRIESPGGDEIGRLAQEFNRMAGALAEKNASIQRQSAELARSNAELARFAYAASHDLQEPLRMVTGYVQLLQKRLADKLDAETQEFMGYAVDGAQRMHSLIEDILVYSRVNTGGKPLNAVDSAAALGEALARLAGRIAETGAEVHAEGLPRVRADRAQLVQLLQNLVGNALKYCKDRAPRVQVEARREDDLWRFSVIDNGIGIEAQYRERIFGIFQRLHTRREYAGTGIGLAICKRIVERHGGQIGVESAPEGGSVFWFTLPEEQST